MGVGLEELGVEEFVKGEFFKGGILNCFKHVKVPKFVDNHLLYCKHSQTGVIYLQMMQIEFGKQ